MTSKTDTQKLKCSACGTDSLPLNRKGPCGSNTLCRPCYEKWKANKIELDSNGKIITGAPQEIQRPQRSSRRIKDNAEAKARDIVESKVRENEAKLKEASGTSSKKKNIETESKSHKKIEITPQSKSPTENESGKVNSGSGSGEKVKKRKRLAIDKAAHVSPASATSSTSSVSATPASATSKSSSPINNVSSTSQSISIPTEITKTTKTTKINQSESTSKSASQSDKKSKSPIRKESKESKESEEKITQSSQKDSKENKTTKPPLKSPQKDVTETSKLKPQPKVLPQIIQDRRPPTTNSNPVFETIFISNDTPQIISRESHSKMLEIKPARQIQKKDAIRLQKKDSRSLAISNKDENMFDIISLNTNQEVKAVRKPENTVNNLIVQEDRFIHHDIQIVQSFEMEKTPRRKRKSSENESMVSPPIKRMKKVDLSSVTLPPPVPQDSENYSFKAPTLSSIVPLEGFNSLHQGSILLKPLKTHLLPQPIAADIFTGATLYKHAQNVNNDKWVKSQLLRYSPNYENQSLQLNHLIYIMTFCDIQTLGRAGLVNSLWNFASNDNIVWKYHYNSRWTIAQSHLHNYVSLPSKRKIGDLDDGLEWKQLYFVRSNLYELGMNPIQIAEYMCKFYSIEANPQILDSIEDKVHLHRNYHHQILSIQERRQSFEERDHILDAIRSISQNPEELLNEIFEMEE